MAYTARPVGVLATLVEQTLTWANEPRISSKYPDYRLYPLLKANYKELIGELVRLTDSPYTVRFTLSVSNGTDAYMVPPNIGHILRICEIDTTTGLASADYYNASKKRVGGPFFVLERNTIRFIPSWTAGTRTITIEYVPNGTVDLAYGTITGPTSSSDYSTTTFTLSTSPTEGYFDKRPNAYLGSVIRVLSASSNPSGYTFFPVQERTISAYTPNLAAGPKVTVTPAFDFTMASQSSLAYEIIPEGLDELTSVLSLRTAITLQRLEGNAKRADELQKEYLSKMREMRLSAASTDMIRGNRFEHEVGIGDSDFPTWG